MSVIKIGNRFVGEGKKPYFIADLAANHDGDLKRAFMLIELAKKSGADAAKFLKCIKMQVYQKIGHAN